VLGRAWPERDNQADHADRAQEDDDRPEYDLRFVALVGIARLHDAEAGLPVLEWLLRLGPHRDDVAGPREQLLDVRPGRRSWPPRARRGGGGLARFGLHGWPGCPRSQRFPG